MPACSRESGTITGGRAWMTSGTSMYCDLFLGVKHVDFSGMGILCRKQEFDWLAGNVNEGVGHKII